MDFKEIVTRARSYRRFQESKKISVETLIDIVDTARIVPSAANGQPLRYAVSASEEMNGRIFPLLGWAAALKTWKGPQEGERPVGYIVIGGDMDNARNHQVDLGIAAQTIQLALAAQGIGCCMLANINAKKIHETVGFSENIGVLLVLAVGYPAETVSLEPLPESGATVYWRDAQDGHHVPKRALKDILLSRFPSA